MPDSVSLVEAGKAGIVRAVMRTIGFTASPPSECSECGLLALERVESREWSFRFIHLLPCPPIEDGNFRICGDADKPRRRYEGNAFSE